MCFTYQDNHLDRFIEKITGNCDFLVGPYTNQIGYYYRYYIFDHLLLEINKYNNLLKNLRK